MIKINREPFSGGNKAPLGEASQRRIETIGITDPGVDDALALFVLNAMPGKIAMVSTYGNASERQASANLVGIADFIDTNLKPNFRKPKLEVYSGADRPLGATEPQAPEGGGYFYIFGDNVVEGQFQGYNPAETPSAVLYDRAAKEDGKLDIVSIAALTEVATMLEHPDLKGKISSVTLMGGAFFEQGNMDTHVEANLAADTKAFDAMLKAAKEQTIPVTIVPLDVTMHPAFELTPERVNDITNKLRANGSHNMATMVTNLAGPSATYPNFYRQKRGVISHTSPIGERRFEGPPIHDLTAILAKGHPEIFETVKTPVVQRYPGVLGVPPLWMTPEQPTMECSVVLGVANPQAYWDRTVEYLSRYQ